MLPNVYKNRPIYLHKTFGEEIALHICTLFMWDIILQYYIPHLLSVVFFYRDTVCVYETVLIQPLAYDSTGVDTRHVLHSYPAALYLALRQSELRSLVESPWREGVIPCIKVSV